MKNDEDKRVFSKETLSFARKRRISLSRNRMDSDLKVFRVEN